MSSAFSAVEVGFWPLSIHRKLAAWESEASGAEPLSFPWQNALTTQMRKAAAQRGDAGLLSLWAGQGSTMARNIGAGELVHQLEREIHEAAETVQSFLPEFSSNKPPR